MSTSSDDSEPDHRTGQGFPCACGCERIVRIMAYGIYATSKCYEKSKERT